MEVSSTDVIEHVEPTQRSGAVIVGGTIHYNIIVIKSKKPGVQPKAVVVPTINRTLTMEEKARIIEIERAKMEASVEELPTDVSGENTTSQCGLDQPPLLESCDV
jgi:hypothetical protein